MFEATLCQGRGGPSTHALLELTSHFFIYQVYSLQEDYQQSIVDLA